MGEKYVSESETEIRFLGAEKPGEFEQMENVGTIQEYNTVRDKTFWENIGVGGSITAKPVVHGDTVYFGACDKNFYALGPEGREKWKFSTGGTIQAGALMAGNLVCFGSGDNNLYALDRETGRLVWKFQSDGPILGTPEEHKGVIYFGSADGNLYAVSAADGRKMWVFRTPHPLVTPLVLGDRIYAGYEGNCIYCLNLNGELIWRFNTTAWVAAWPAAHGNDTLYIGGGNNTLYALGTDGRMGWKYQANGVVMSPVAKDGKIYFGCGDNKIYCLDSGGRKLWDFSAKDSVSNITIDGNMIYFGSYDNHMYAADKDTGRLLWKFPTNGFVHGNPAVHGDCVIFGSWDCHLYCLDKEGKLIWKFRTSLGSPSKIGSPEQVTVKKLEVIMTVGSEKKEEKRYKAAELEGNYDANVTEYASGVSKTYLSSKKKGYIGN